MDALVTSLVPSLSRSLTRQFNLFHVLRHGTHEKQLSNVFAWLLDADETHGLGDVFQRIFIKLINEQIDSEPPLPFEKYRVQQEVDTAIDETAKDIADIVMFGKEATVVIENFISSDGHGHDYYGYLNFGAQGGTQSVVVLLCSRHEPARQIDGWQHAVVITYVHALKPLKEHVMNNAAWCETHAPQNYLLTQLFEHFIEGPNAVNSHDQIEFIKVLCETGESERYGKRPLDNQAEEFSDLIAQHAKRQFEEGRVLLGKVKRALRDLAESVVRNQINARADQELVGSARARLAGQYEWYVVLHSPEGNVLGGFVFGPSAVFYNSINNRPIDKPDYSQIFAMVETKTQADYVLVETGVGFAELATGVPAEDTRLSEAFLRALRKAAAHDGRGPY